MTCQGFLLIVAFEFLNACTLSLENSISVLVISVVFKMRKPKTKLLEIPTCTEYSLLTL